MHYAPADPSCVVDLRSFMPVMRFIRAARARMQDGAAEHGLSGVLPGGSGGHGLMRRMLVAAAIACGLVALWALLLPVVA